MSCDVSRDTTRTNSNNSTCKTRKSITCNDVYLDNRDDFINLEECRKLLRFLRRVAPLHKKLYHFTTMDKFAKIYHSKRFRFSSAYKTNDLQEVLQKGDPEQWNHVYSVSFSHGDFNNMGMWKMYGGICQYEALCLEFSAEDVIKWKNGIKRQKDIKKDNDEMCPTAGFSISFHDIAYIHGTQERNAERVCWGNIVNSRIAKALADINDIIRKNEPISKKTYLTGFIKNSAWEQEKESRIMIKLPALTLQNYVTVPIDSLLNNCKIHFSPFSKISDHDSFNLMRDFFSSNDEIIPETWKNKCHPSYFKYLVK